MLRFFSELLTVPKIVSRRCRGARAGVQFLPCENAHDDGLGSERRAVRSSKRAVEHLKRHPNLEMIQVARNDGAIDLHSRMILGQRCVICRDEHPFDTAMAHTDSESHSSGRGSATPHIYYPGRTRTHPKWEWGTGSRSPFRG